jgi:hypothetical protein
MAMSNLKDVILLLACSFYVYVAFRLSSHMVSIRRESRRASPTVLEFPKIARDQYYEGRAARLVQFPHPS